MKEVLYVAIAKQKANVSKAEYRRFVENNRIAQVIEVIQRLPLENQIAIEFYLKGRLDAESESIEIPFRAMAGAGNA